MSPIVIVLHIVITCLLAAFAVVGLLFPLLKNRKKVLSASTEEISDVGEADAKEIENKAENSVPEESSDTVKTISLKATVIYSCISFIFIVFSGLWSIFFFGNEDVLFMAKRVLLISVLFVAAYYDHAAYRIPNKLILYGLCSRLVILIFELIFARDGISQVLISEGIAVGAMLILSVVCLIVTRKGLGMGDVKLFLLMAMLQGIAGVISSLFASLLVSFVYSVILLISKKKSRKDFIPFAPCILVGTFISIMLVGA